MDRLLIPIQGLKVLEDQNKWLDACQLLHDEWTQDKSNVGKLVHTALECWYVMLEGSVIGFSEDEDEYVAIGKILLECSKYGLSVFRDRFAFIWAFSYMISVSPLPFSWNDATDKEYLRWESIGKQLKEEGLNLYAEHPLAKLSFIEYPDYDMYQVAIRASGIRPEIYFPDDNAIDSYFREIYSAHVQ